MAIAYKFEAGDLVEHKPYSGRTPYRGRGTVVGDVRHLGMNLVEVRWDSGSVTKQGRLTLRLLRAAPKPQDQSLRFKAGDDVKFYNNAATQRGKVVQDCRLTDLNVFLKLHSESVCRWVYHKSVSKEPFVVIDEAGPVPQKIDALELLRGCWQDLHIPYQQRDQARAELKGATDVIEDLRNKLAAERLENVKLRETIANGQRALEHKA